MESESMEHFVTIAANMTMFVMPKARVFGQSTMKAVYVFAFQMLALLWKGFTQCKQRTSTATTVFVRAKRLRHFTSSHHVTYWPLLCVIVVALVALAVVYPCKHTQTEQSGSSQHVDNSTKQDAIFDKSWQLATKLNASINARQQTTCSKETCACNQPGIPLLDYDRYMSADSITQARMLKSRSTILFDAYNCEKYLAFVKARRSKLHGDPLVNTNTGEWEQIRKYKREADILHLCLLMQHITTGGIDNKPVSEWEWMYEPLLSAVAIAPPTNAHLRKYIDEQRRYNQFQQEQSAAIITSLQQRVADLEAVVVEDEQISRSLADLVKIVDTYRSNVTAEMRVHEAGNAHSAQLTDMIRSTCRFFFLLNTFLLIFVVSVERLTGEQLTVLRLTLTAFAFVFPMLTTPLGWMM